MSTYSVVGSDGKTRDVELFTKEQVVSMASDPDAEVRNKLVMHMRALGKKPAEIMKMPKAADKIEWVLRRYEQLEAEAGGSKKSSKGAAQASARAGLKSVSRPKDEEEEEEDDEEEEEEAPAPKAKTKITPAAAAPKGTAFDPTMQLLAIQEALAKMPDLHKLAADVERLADMVQAQAVLTLDTHYLVRVMALSSIGMSVEELNDPEFREEHYSIPVVQDKEEEEEEDEEGND